MPGSLRDASPVFHLTPTKIEDFEACPLRFDLVHLRQVVRNARTSSPYIAFGISMHEWLHHFYRQGGYERIVRQDMSRLLDQCWTTNGYVDATEQSRYRDMARDMCEQYYIAFRDDPTRHLAHEGFSRAQFRLDGIGVLLSGKIDRISIWQDGHLEIVDYKTGNGLVPTAAKLATSTAAFLYYILARCNYPDYDRIDVSYLYLQKMVKVTVTYNAEQLIEHKSHLRHIVRQIADANFPPKPDGHCGWCAARPVCPAMQQEEIDLDSLL